MNGKKFVSLCRREIGVRESPPNSNKVKYNTSYYGREVSGSDYPWCMVYVYEMFKTHSCLSAIGGHKTASTVDMDNFFRENGFKKVGVSECAQGDIVFFDFGYWKKGRGHVGIISEPISNTSFRSIEGNTSVSSNDNGGKVMERTRDVSQVHSIYRPRWENVLLETSIKKRGLEVIFETLKKGASGWQVKALSHLLNGHGVSNLSHTGYFGDATESAVKKYQTKNDLEVDGIVGVNTWSKLLCKK